MIKRIINSILLAVMLVNLFAFAAMAKDDITGTKYEEEVRVLSALGIMGGYEDLSFRPDSLISRGEFASVVARLIYEDNPGKVGDAYFADVPKEHWAAGAIYLLADMGYIKTGTRFKPEEGETYYDAIRTLVKLLGYGDYADANGGYPKGYITTASALGLLDGIVITNEDAALTRGMAARLVYNALEVDFYHSDNLDVEETILSRRNIITGRGILVATETASINGYANAGIGRAVIEGNDSEIYKVKLQGFDATALLGRSGSFYIDEEEELLIYFFGKIKGEELYIGAGEIEDVAGNVISYRRGNSIKKVTVSENATVIVNGETVDTDNPGAYYWPEVGSVRLTKSSDSSKYDLVYVEDYETYIADAVIVNDEKLVFKPGLGKEGYIKADEFDEVKITRDGVKAKLSDIKEWDVLHIARKSDNQSITINAVSTSTVTGEVTAMGEDVVYIADKEYRIDLRVYEQGLYPAIEPGISAVFYYNMNGEIFAWKKDSALVGTYGYLKNIRINEEEMQAYSTIYTLDGEFLRYQYDDRVSVNGTKFEDEELMFATDIHTGEKAIDQLVKYKTGANGKITKIETAQKLEDSKYKANGYDDSEFTLVLENDFAHSKFMTMDHFNSGKFDDTYVADKNTKVIIVPESLKEDSFDVTTVKDAFTANTKYRDNRPLDIGEVKLYNADRYLVVPLIVCKTAKGSFESDSIDYSSEIMLIDKAITTVNAENDVVKMISGIYKGSRVSYEVKDGLDIDGLDIGRGSAVQIKVNKENRISGIRKVFDINEEQKAYVESFDNQVGKNETAAWNANLLVYCGNVTDINNDGTQMVVNSGLDWDRARGFYSSGMKVYKYSLASKTAEVGSVKDIVCSNTNPQKVIFRAYRSLVKELVIIED